MQQLKLMPWAFGLCELCAEWGTGNGALDLLIRIQTFDDGEWVIAIENKVWASKPRQLKGYREAVERAFPAAKCRVFIFLSRRDQGPEDKAWLSASYKQVREELKTLLNEQKDLIGPEPAVLIRHYLEILEEVSMSPRPNCPARENSLSKPPTLHLKP